MLEALQPFVVREECGQATFASATARGTIRLAAAGILGPWFLLLEAWDRMKADGTFRSPDL